MDRRTFRVGDLRRDKSRDIAGAHFEVYLELDALSITTRATFLRQFNLISLSLLSFVENQTPQSHQI